MLDQLEAFQQAADADLAAILRGEMWDLVDQYDQLKRRAGKLDFVDLLLLARDLVRDKPDVRRYLQDRFTHIFIDEFQDTDPLQAEILLLLAADDPAESDWLKVAPTPGKLFVVGDPKQSVYKFRRADVVLYREIRDALQKRGVGVVQLTTSFRALRPIQQLVNAAFRTRNAGRCRFGPGGLRAAARRNARHCQAAQHRRAARAPALRKHANLARRPSMPACRKPSWRLSNGWCARAAGKSAIPKTRRNCCPFRPATFACCFAASPISAKTLLAIMFGAWRPARSRILLVGSKSFHSREEVETLRAALTAIEWPEDELSVFATLKGSLFAIPDNLLLRFHHEIGRLHPFPRAAGESRQRFHTRSPKRCNCWPICIAAAIDGRSPIP